MKLEHSFDVPASEEKAWALLMDVPRVIPCMPGAKLTETIDDEHWKAEMHVKLGPIALVFATDVRREEAAADERRAKLSAQARELRGRGGGQATIESRLIPSNGGTRVDIATELTLSGPVAQYGRGIMEDVSRRLVTSFAECLRTQLAAPHESWLETLEHKPVAGVRLGLRALGRTIGGFFRRLVRRG